MLKNIFLFFIFVFLAVGMVPAQEINPERPVDLSLEINMMLHLQLEIEYYFNESFGIKTGLGLSPLGITCFSYMAQFVYHLNLPTEHFQLDLEAGLPLAYFDFIEGRYVDWDPIIDDPYYGFLTGGGILASYRFNKKQALGLRAGIAAMFEHQLNTGWRKPIVMPIVSLVYNF